MLMFHATYKFEMKWLLIPNLFILSCVTLFRKKLRDVCEDELYHDGLDSDLLEDCSAIKS